MTLRLAAVLGAAVALVAVASPAPAQGPGSPATSDAGSTTTTAQLRPAPRIAFVDVEDILLRSRAIRRVIDELDIELATAARRIDETRRELSAARLALTERERLLSDEERARQRIRIAELQEDLDVQQFRFDRNLRDKQRATIEPILERLFGLIADVGEREGYDMVLRGEVVLYGKPSVDLTDAVLQEVERRRDDLLRASRVGDRSTTTGLERRRAPNQRRGGDDSLFPLIP